ncbi:response regulator transcription factor [Amycolatopsis sp.]|uniref:response regulator transcription factor n=1 Tax=Amycolatopsis sp. TaxID=37632 RepID=UPI002C2FCD22|nr:response regulator transcription factor [Amycolatopsis sp.]HVV11888.1 response regulator transcription factor [Amycolatopsis sp.]
MSEAYRLLLCDDHSMMRSGLRRILSDVADVVVVGETGTVAKAVELAGIEKPDVVVMDLSLPDQSGITAIEQIHRESAHSKVLVLTMHDDVAYLREALAAGAIGYLVKVAADTELVRAVRAVASGTTYVDPTLVTALVDGNASSQSRVKDPLAALSERERDILRHLALGYTNPEMATKLTLSVRTVETYRARIQQKLGLRSRADLARLAREAGLTR